MAYSRLTQEQRYQIHELKQQGKSQGGIARRIGVDLTTVGRERRDRKLHPDDRGPAGFLSGRHSNSVSPTPNTARDWMEFE
jgi:hypothetical protein